jgi:hypothetical protein
VLPYRSEGQRYTVADHPDPGAVLPFLQFAKTGTYENI